MSSTLAQPADVEVDLRAVFRSLRRALPVLLILGILAAGATYALLSLSDPSYQAETRILIETGESSLTQTVDPTATATLLDQEGIASQVQLIRSRDVALAVIEELNLATHPDFDPAQQSPGLVDSLLAKVGLGGGPSDVPVEELVLSTFFSQLDVNAIAATRVISIKFTSTDPRLAAAVTNAVAQEYIDLQRTARRDLTADATEWLQDEISVLSTELREAEAAVESFRSANNLYTTQNNLTLAQQQLADLSATQIQVRADRVSAEARGAQIRAEIEAGRGFSTPEVLASPVIQALKGQEATLRAQIAEASATMLPGHPRLRELNAQLADLTGQIRAEAQRILTGVDAEAELARAREADITEQMDELRAAAATSNAAEVQLRALQREADAVAAQLEDYLSRYRDAVSRQNADLLPVNARIISPASAPIEPVFPKKVPMAAAAMVVVIMLGGAIVLVRELSSGRATRPVSARAPIPVAPAGVVPPRGGTRLRRRDRRTPQMMPSAEPPSIVSAEVERSLSAIAGRIHVDRARRIVTTFADDFSAGGRPLAAVALSRTLAKGGARVLLVELNRDDADRIAIGESPGLQGFADLFAGEASFAQVIFRDRTSPAHFIGAGRKPGAPIAGDRLTALLDALDQTYDHVVYDIGPELVPALAPGASAVVMASDSGPADPRTVAAYEAVKAVSEAEILLLVTAPEAVTLTSPDEPMLDVAFADAEGRRSKTAAA